MFGTTRTRPLHACFLTSALALAGAGMAAPAQAQTAYDGPWSVVIATRAGPCPSTLRYGVAILNGQIISPAGGEADVRGRVTPRGAVSVTVRSGGAWAVGSGSLGRLTGGGVWRGQSSSDACAGTWVAQRSGPMTAQARGAPFYDYAPGPASRAAAAPSAASCAARYRSYDPATGTFLGNDGLRHPCR